MFILFSAVFVRFVRAGIYVNTTVLKRDVVNAMGKQYVSTIRNDITVEIVEEGVFVVITNNDQAVEYVIRNIQRKHVRKRCQSGLAKNK